ncbi:MFS transporter [Prauserella flavalba]|uniref:MFS transporter n=1 Tax=Prauserella flavalba TaxID=1477506 RepID=A0A318LEG8_9PSEU|nr:MFS transporter [Prauserella flavalba]PXY24431.1 MFS transporter [Prauserella flavalba]
MSGIPESTAPATTASEGLNNRHMRRILASSFLGSAVEYYDFLLYATAAAVVFNHVFFTGLGPGLAAFASFGTLAAGYVARPLGGVLFGHFGDRLGRKKVLVVSMLTMGLATTLIGLLPPTSQLGAAAPVLLVTLRIVQGLAVGGEWGGAMTIALEHAPGGRRGFAASFANMGAPAGALLATVAVGLCTLLPEDDFLRWGWRIPFLFSMVLVLIGLFIRLKVTESPLFTRFEAEAKERRLPIVEVLTGHGRQVVVGLLAGISMFTLAGMATVWAVNVAVANGADKTGVLNSKAAAALVMLVTTIVSARVCDRLGRKPVMVTGVLGAMAFAYPLLLLVESGSVLGFTVAVMGAQALQGIVFGPYAAFLAELFPTRIRFTGASLCFQGASTLGAGFTPAIAAGLVVAGGGGMALLGAVWVGVLAVCLVAILAAKEGRSRDLG